MGDFFQEIRSFISQNKYLLLKSIDFSFKVQQFTIVSSIVLNFWPVICKNKKFMNFFVKTDIFLVFSRSRIFLLSILISGKMANENCQNTTMTT